MSNTAAYETNQRVYKLKESKINHISIKKSIVFSVISLLVLVSSSQIRLVYAINPETEWFSQVELVNTDDKPMSIIQTEDGNYIIVGTITRASDKSQKALLIKMDSDGKTQWRYGYHFVEPSGEILNATGNSVLQTSDGGYLLVGTRKESDTHNSIFWWKINSDAEDMYYRITGWVGKDTFAGDSIIASDGGYLVLGYTNYYGTNDLLLVKVDSNGTREWLKIIRDDTSDETAGRIISSGNGGYVILAMQTRKDPTDKFRIILSQINSNATLEWYKTFKFSNFDIPSDIKKTSDGGYIISGSSFKIVPTLVEPFLAKVDSQGALKWNQTYTFIEASGANHIQLAGDDGIIVAGAKFLNFDFTSLQTDALIFKTDSEGQFKWNATLNYGSVDEAISIVQVDEFEYVVAGYTGNTTAANDIFVTKIYIDTTPPTLTSLLPLPVTNDKTSEIKISFSDDKDIELSSVKIQLDSSIITSESTITPSGFTYTPTTPLPEGKHDIKIWLSDEAGNLVTGNWSFTVHYTPPTISMFTPADSSLTRNNKPLFNITYADPMGIDTSSIVLTLDNVPVIGLNITQSSTTYIPSSSLSDGKHNASIKVADVIGNTITSYWSFIVDTTLPKVNFMSFTDAMTFYNLGNKASIEIKFTYSDNFGINQGSISLKLDDIDITSQASITATEVSTFREIASGSHILKINVSDNAGNYVDSRISFTIIDYTLYIIRGTVIVIAAAALLIMSLKRKKF